jgi:hypothetical protein
MSNDDQPNEFAAFQNLYSKHTTLELIKAMAKVREHKDALDAELKGVGKEYEFLARIAIPEAFENDGIKNMNVDGIGRVALRADIFASIKAGQKEKAYEWLQDIGSGDLIVPQVAPSTLKAFLKARIKKGDENPEDLFNISPFQSASITKT